MARTICRSPRMDISHSTLRESKSPSHSAQHGNDANSRRRPIIAHPAVAWGSKYTVEALYGLVCLHHKCGAIKIASAAKITHTSQIVHHQPISAMYMAVLQEFKSHLGVGRISGHTVVDRLRLPAHRYHHPVLDHNEFLSWICNSPMGKEI